MPHVLTENCPELAIIQHAESGDYDYTEYGSIEKAWEAEQADSWVKDALELDEGRSLESVRNEFVSSLKEYDQEQILDAVKEGYSWPQELGFTQEADSTYEIEDEDEYEAE